MKTTLILYGSTKRYSAEYKRVTNPDRLEYYVRAELSSYDLKEALDRAKPRAGEVVINTVEIGK